MRCRHDWPSVINIESGGPYRLHPTEGCSVCLVISEAAGWAHSYGDVVGFDADWCVQQVNWQIRS